MLGWEVEIVYELISQRHSRYEPPGHWKQRQGNGTAVQHGRCWHVVVTK